MNRKGRPGVRTGAGFLQRGFTVISLTVTMFTAGILIAGGWMSYCSMQRQWKIANAERMMDQYAHSAFQELTNDVSWAWGAKQMSSGRIPRWRIYMDDVIQEHGRMATLWQYRRDGIEENKKYITLSYAPTLGILINNQVPPWAGSRWAGQYLWTGGAPRDGTTKAFDRRDRMEIRALDLDYNRNLEYRPESGDALERTKRERTLTVRMVLHYEYHGFGDFGLYGEDYVRERVYETQIYMRNWDVDRNAYRDDLLGIDRNSGSGT